ncbi:MAG TPA: 23S rRNA (uracil(1939)-C(5))-methyltransferase RlmD [Candidatus Acidoferrales bacterium]|nr:23S rRNA (uracil(1939)-C(5))-methyltransferase RlmD [Candidatus Acidoferrales bacterium]
MDVTIEKLIYGGEGLAHYDGSPVFVPFVLPGEQVAVAPVEQKKKFVRARLEKILVASPERTVAPCPHFGVCGGCDYQHIPYESQLTHKTQILRETMRRLGRVEWAGEITAHASPPWGYRHRAQWKVRPLGEEATGNAAESRGANLRIGYFRANSTSLCAVEDCAILSPLLLSTLLRLREALAAGALPRSLREIEAFADASDSKLLLTATFAGFPSRAAELAETIKGVVPQIESLLFNDPGRDRMELFGPGFLTYETAGAKYRVGHFSFFQVNRFLMDELVLEVAEREPGGQLALDLFAGVGLFSVPLAQRFARVIAVESNPAAARDLEGNIRSGGQIEVRTSDVERFLEKYKGRPEFVLLDPPRAGLTDGTIQRLAALSPERITYVSCEPPTLARDLTALRARGYELTQVHLFDLFPQTFHMEAVVRLSRRQ